MEHWDEAMNISFHLVIPVLLPTCSGLLLGFFRPLREPRARHNFLIATLALNAAVVMGVILQPDMRLELFRLSDRLPIMLQTDELARLFCALTALMFLIVGIYSPSYMRHEGDEARFHMFYLIVLGMLMGFGFSGNLMTLYLFLEMVTLSTVPLVLHSLKKEATAAAFKYLYYSIAGTSLALIGFFFIYTYGTTLEFSPGGILDTLKIAGREKQMLTVTLLTVIGFGAKAGMFPLHAWLPAAHPVAPSPASAVLSGVITKIGVFAVIRFVYYLVGPDFIRGTWAQTAWISLALFTVVMGSLLAFREQELKRRLAYSSVSQVSYIMFGLGTLTADGLIGALMHTIFHSIAKNALFLIAGAIILKTHKTGVAELRGVGKQMPVTLGCFALLAVTLAGIPPASGFTSKWYLSVGSLAADTGFFTWLGPVVLLSGAMLSAGYLFPIAIRGFFPGAGYDYDSGKLEPGLSMTIPILLLTAAAVILGIIPGSLIALCERIAIGLL